eukprot:TRINITY_DN12457_c0_g2_i1.p1 TRINITY_DN12457_c0_g2~~TRINITY_DN12457_c0_g2_i1.p1  ORF type:complete len:717 (+),score=195.28 TRINITY_DN12457_c0_g2_i1:110-2260(+)
MNFPVPWRALLPLDAVPAVCGNANTLIKEIVDRTGACVDISGEGETPATLSDKICTVSGAVEQKEAACRRIVDVLRGVQEVADQEPGVFVVIVPASSVPAVIGTKGSQIKEIIELSGAEISVGKEPIQGMSDQPIGITGTGGQVVSAVSKINAILQDLADRSRLQPGDFKWREGAVASVMPPIGSGPRGSSNPRTHAKFVAPTQVAGWIIGKQGRHIRELQENSGAHIQVHREGDVPPGVPMTERVIEIGGGKDAKAEGVQIVLMAIDSMPALQAPRETPMLIPKALSTDGHLREVRQMSGADVELRDLPGHDEALCTVIGTIEARIKAAQQFLAMLEEGVAKGSLGDAAPMSSSPSPAAAPAFSSRPAQSAPAAPMAASQERSPVYDPPRPAAPQLQSSAGAVSGSQADPWSQGAPAAPSASQLHWQSDKEPAGAAACGAAQSAPVAASWSDPVRTEAARSVSFGHQEVVNIPSAGPGTDSDTSPMVRQSAALPSTSTFSSGAAPSLPGQPPLERQAALAANGTRFGSSGAGGSMSSTAPAPGTPAAEGVHGRGTPMANGSMGNSFDAAAPGGCVGGMAMGGMNNMNGVTGMGGMNGQMSGASPFMSPSGFGGGAWGDNMFRSALQESAFCAGSNAKLALLLPLDLLQKALIPLGYLSEIAEKCQIRIDLGPEVMCLQEAKGQVVMRQVSMTGSVAGNALAAYFLQERAAQCCVP